ncbi:hypothetical protein FAY30_19880 [Bacillus sp. S3]|uniref:SCP2 sterol-binding domain-containing protein n=1 Tax=Bacillus sp. S3 TaxID=486398 RepID=UPI00118AEE75|nr:SCP2 sterol-binding domain-containing protein [Bacillus sp. S3]QCJ43981.1 hypothetical protein FAY30_19880 [Bacillus sp. S3]
MIEAVEAFLVKVKEQGHILPLIQQADVQINLQWAEQQSIQLIIKSGGICITHNPDFQQRKYMISGSPTAMIQLIEGTERLRVLEQQGQLKIIAPLRTILLLESIFFLTKAELAKII